MTQSEEINDALKQDSMNLKQKVNQLEKVIDQQKEEFASLNATVSLISEITKNQI